MAQILGSLTRWARWARAVALALVVHVVFGLMVGIGLRFESKIVETSLVKPVQAVVIDQALINREKERKADQEQQREEAKQKELEKKQAKQAEEKRQSELKKRQEAERERKAQLKKRKEAEAKRLAEEKKKEAETKRLVEKKKKEAEEARQRDEQLAGSALGALVGEIKDKVKRNWTYAGDTTGLEMIISVKVTRDGEVMSANVVRSSGDTIFDRSAENAVLKASPLPFPLTVAHLRSPD